MAATGVSPSLPEQELDDARALAAELGARHLVVATHEGERPGYLRNGPDRCFFCKDELFEVLGPLAGAEGLALAVGTNTDDLGDHRPGQRAAAAHGVLTPLVAAGLSKAEVRQASRRLGLRTADKPAAACLASRIAYGVQVTPARLSRVERAEALLRSFGLAQLRVRDHGDLARVEVPVEALADLVEPDRRARLVAGLRELGFTWVTLDLEGFRSGSMNATLGGPGGPRPSEAPGPLHPPPGAGPPADPPRPGQGHHRRGQRPPGQRRRRVRRGLVPARALRPRRPARPGRGLAHRAGRHRRADRRVTAVPLRRNRDFLLLQAGQLLSGIGTQSGLIAYPLLVLAADGVGGQGGGGRVRPRAVPRRVLALPAGVVADRWNRRRLMIAADAVRVLAVGGLAAAIVATGSPSG